MAVDVLVPVLTALGLSQQQAVTVWQPLILYIAGMAVYSIFVFELYHFISRKNIFELDLAEYARGKERVKNTMRVVLHFAKYLLVFPVFPMIWGRCCRLPCSVSLSWTASRRSLSNVSSRLSKR